jgi:hypothetical protein
MANGDVRTRKFIEVIPPPSDVLPPVQAPELEAFAARVPVAVDLGPLTPLLGVWKANGTGWNMIALPFEDAPAPPNGFDFRVLMNQYDEELSFTFVDDDVPNRGRLRLPNTVSDQMVVTIDYQQKISQVAAEDRPPSPLAGPPGLGIHHEPGLWLYMKNLQSVDDESVVDVARLASIPHGNSVLAVGHSAQHEGMPDIPKLNALPFGRFEDIDTPGYDFKTDPYLRPYRHYVNNPFKGTAAGVPGFPGFQPGDMNEILRFANTGVNVKRTTTLIVDTTRERAGIVNAPFAAREATAVSMKSTFWIQELHELDAFGQPKFRLQYSQVVMLDFFRPREDELPGRASWPHVSIATLEKVPANYGLVRDEPGTRV